MDWIKNISFSDGFILLSTSIAAIGGYFRMMFKVDQVEKDGNKRGDKLESILVEMEKKITPLENQMRAQEQQTAALNATLTAIQLQLASVSNRLDTIITNLLKN